MLTIWADFNARTAEDNISLETDGSRADITKFGIHPGSYVWLSDGEMRVVAKVDFDQHARLVGVPSWATLESSGG